MILHRWFSAMISFETLLRVTHRVMSKRRCLWRFTVSAYEGCWIERCGRFSAMKSNYIDYRIAHECFYSNVKRNQTVRNFVFRIKIDPFIRSKKNIFVGRFRSIQHNTYVFSYRKYPYTFGPYNWWCKGYRYKMIENDLDRSVLVSNKK